MEDIKIYKTITMEEKQYYRFLDAIESVGNIPGMAVALATSDKIEQFSPPIFAAFCSKNAKMCIERLADLDVYDSFSARVRAALTELLPAGICGIDEVASELGLSKRTLQRKLSEENTTFQKQLNSTREVLAVHYIKNTDMTTNDIAFLLGYAELNSFLRAFSVWTGKKRY